MIMLRWRTQIVTLQQTFKSLFHLPASWHSTNDHLDGLHLPPALFTKLLSLIDAAEGLTLCFQKCTLWLCRGGLLKVKFPPHSEERPFFQPSTSHHIHQQWANYIEVIGCSPPCFLFVKQQGPWDDFSHLGQCNRNLSHVQTPPWETVITAQSPGCLTYSPRFPSNAFHSDLAMKSHWRWECLPWFPHADYFCLPAFITSCKPPFFPAVC